MKINRTIILDTQVKLSYIQVATERKRNATEQKGAGEKKNEPNGIGRKTGLYTTNEGVPGNPV